MSLMRFITRERDDQRCTIHSSNYENKLYLFEQSKILICLFKVVTYWLAKLKNYDDKVEISDEHQDYKWCTLVEAVKLAPRHADIITKVGKLLKYLCKIHHDWFFSSTIPSHHSEKLL